MTGVTHSSLVAEIGLVLIVCAPLVLFVFILLVCVKLKNRKRGEKSIEENIDEPENKRCNKKKEHQERMQTNVTANVQSEPRECNPPPAIAAVIKQTFQNVETTHKPSNIDEIMLGQPIQQQIKVVQNLQEKGTKSVSTMNKEDKKPPTSLEKTHDFKEHKNANLDDLKMPRNIPEIRGSHEVLSSTSSWKQFVPDQKIQAFVLMELSKDSVIDREKIDHHHSQFRVLNPAAQIQQYEIKMSVPHEGIKDGKGDKYYPESITSRKTSSYKKQDEMASIHLPLPSSCYITININTGGDINEHHSKQNKPTFKEAEEKLEEVISSRSIQQDKTNQYESLIRMPLSSNLASNSQNTFVAEAEKTTEKFKENSVDEKLLATLGKLHDYEKEKPAYPGDDYDVIMKGIEDDVKPQKQFEQLSEQFGNANKKAITTKELNFKDGDETPEEAISSPQDKVDPYKNIVDVSEKESTPSSDSTPQSRESTPATRKTMKSRKENKKNQVQESSVDLNSGFTPKPIPLRNLGNTCYFNSVLQALFQTRILGHLLKQFYGKLGAQKYRCGLTGSMSEFYYGKNPNHGNILQQVQRRSNKFHGYKQEDSHELLRHLCCGLTEEQREVEGNDCETCVESVFGGHTLSSFLCLRCYQGYHLVEKFFDLSIPVSFSSGDENDCVADLYTGNIKDDYSRVLAEMLLQKPPSARKKTISVEDCLNYFTKRELMPYLCEKCYEENPSMVDDDSLPDALNRILILNLPPILTIHLKRFEQTPYGKFTKCGCKVKYEKIIDLSPYCCNIGPQHGRENTMDQKSKKRKQQESGRSAEQCDFQDYQQNATNSTNLLYSLYGVVVHGGSMDSGHYVAYVKTRRDKTRELAGYIKSNKFDSHTITREWLETKTRHLSEEKEAKKSKFSDDSDWWYISDSSVHSTSEECALNQEAFLLFYEKL